MLALLMTLALAAPPSPQKVEFFQPAPCSGMFCTKTKGDDEQITYYLRNADHDLKFRTGVLRDSRKKRQVKLPKTGYVEKVSFLFSGSYLFLAYTENYGGEGGGHIALVDLNTFQPRWIVRQISGGNLNPILTTNGFLVASYGIIGLIDAKTGRFRWRHNDLYERTGYQYFDDVRWIGPEVEVCSGKCLERGRDLSMVVVNHNTGEIVQPKLKKYVLPR
jgi:hypothetical protein